MLRRSRRLGAAGGQPRRSVFARILRTVLLAILIAFVFGLVVGTILRRELDRPLRYMGEARPEASEAFEVSRFAGVYDLGSVSEVSEGLVLSASPGERAPVSVAAPDPGHVPDPLSRVLVTSHHEEQIG